VGFEFGQSMCFVQPIRLRSDDDAGQSLGEKKTGKLPSNNFWVVRRFLSEKMISLPACHQRAVGIFGLLQLSEHWSICILFLCCMASDSNHF
jgi:hypothetical protein